MPMDETDQKVVEGLMSAMLGAARSAVESGAEPDVVGGMIPHLRRLHAMGVWKDADNLLAQMERIAAAPPAAATDAVETV